MYLVQRKGRDVLEDLGIDERLILKWILKIQGVRIWARFSWLEWRAVLNTLMNLRVRGWRGIS
jgi:hypothetical protein